MEFNPATPIYWNMDLLEQEALQTFDICSGCRRCKDLCPTFEFLFYTIDNTNKGRAGNLSLNEIYQAVDLCYLCRHCQGRCPYKAPHEHDINIPHLVMRARAVPSRTAGISFQSRLLGNADYTGRLGCALRPLSNHLIKNRLWRVLLEKTAGIDREYKLRKFNRRPFSKLYKKSRKASGSGVKTNRRVALYPGCSINYHEGGIGEAMIDVLRHNGCEVAVIDALSCGYAHLEAGDIEAAVGCARENIILFKKYIDEGFTVVIAEPSCHLTIKHEYFNLIYEQSDLVFSKSTISFINYIYLLNKSDELSMDFKFEGGKILYHNLYYPEYIEGVNPGAEILRKLPGSNVAAITEPTIGAGIWGMKRKYRSLRSKRFKDLFEEFENYGPDYIVTDSSETGLQYNHKKSTKIWHFAEILKKGYGI